MRKEEWEKEKLSYGKESIEITLPKRNLLAVLQPQYLPVSAGEQAEIKRALSSPIGTRSLSEIARGKSTATIVINDITRPTPSKKIVPLIVKELKRAGIRQEKMVIIIATGSHRSNTPGEIDTLLGSSLAKNIKVLNHDCTNQNMLVSIGETQRGIPVVINKVFWEAEVKILTGTISPHQSAGFTGGRKSVLPGLSGLETLRYHHGLAIRPEAPAMGWWKDNPFHLEAVEAAKMAKVDFILNVVQNNHKKIIKAVAGDLEQAWERGVKESKKMYQVEVPSQAEIVITSPGGFPKDINLWQSQKAIAAAETIVKEGGTIIVPAECSKGIGLHEFYEWLEVASNPDDVMERFEKEGYSRGSSKAYLYARALKKAQVIIVTNNLSGESLNKIFLQKAQSVEEAVEKALKKMGRESKIIILKNATDMIPKLRSL